MDVPPNFITSRVTSALQDTGAIAGVFGPADSRQALRAQCFLLALAPCAHPGVVRLRRACSKPELTMRE
jgi:hypothetical protein